ncbi:sulfurtransferase [Thiofilum flexile]|uniref:sulfurtransferase n=1 Tax=Thiofilum flexile TaxID=125627 RepID=UPI00037D2DBB|nr:sulfurtransferase [Thiofilum flexile]
MYQTLISVPTLVENLSNPDWLILDCRFSLADTELGRFMYEGSHIQGAYYLHLDHDLSSPITPLTGRHPMPDAEQLSAKLRACGLNNDTQVVVYDDNIGAMAARAWWLLRWLGHDQVAVLDGGFDAWQKAQAPVTSELPAPRQGHFTAHSRADYSVEANALMQPNHAWQLVDARAAERFRGEKEPIDPIAGHIPNAWNRPLTDNVAGIYFKAPEVLRAEWEALLKDTPVEQVVHMCGSGVTACHNQLAMEHAGLTGSKLYPGSWSEWIRDPERPIALGTS